MAFALTGFEAFPIKVEGAQPRRAVQRVVLHATGTTADVDLDIGSDAGTFWAAADNTDLGAAALADLQAIIAQSTCLSYVYCPQIDAAGERSGGSALTTVYTSSTSPGGSATVAYTVTGLATTDTVLSVDPITSGTLGRSEITSILSAVSVGGDTTEAYTVTGLLTTDTILSVTPEVAGSLGRPTEVVLTGTVATGSATPTAVVTGLLTTDTILAVDQVTANANSLPLIGRAATCAVNDALALVYSADTGGSGTIAVTVQRAATTDVLTPVAWGTQIADGLTVTYGADPGSGAKVRVTVQRAATTDKYVPLSYGTQIANGLTVVYGGDPGTGASVRVTVSRAATPSLGADYNLTFENSRPNWLFAASNGLTAYTIFLDYHLNVNVLPFVKTYGIGA